MQNEIIIDGMTMEELEVQREKDRVIAMEIMNNLSLEDLPGEVWKDIPEFENYKVSSFGRIKSTERWTSNMYNTRTFHKARILKMQINYKGYPIVRIFQENEKKTFVIHRLIGKLFVPNPFSLPQINHRYGVKIDNRTERLEWITNKDNHDQAWKTGLKTVGIMPRGENHGQSKFTNEQILEIRENKNRVSKTEFAKEYSVCESTIGRILRNETWQHLNVSQ